LHFTDYILYLQNLSLVYAHAYFSVGKYEKPTWSLPKFCRHALIGPL